MEYLSLADRRQQKRVVFQSQVDPGGFRWRGRFKRMALPLARTIPVCGTGKRLNHHILYLRYKDVPVLVVSGHFIKSQAIDVQAACDVIFRTYMQRGWKPSQYLSGLGRDHLLSTIKNLIGEIDDGGDDPFRFFDDKVLLKIVKKVLKSYEI